MQVDACCRTRKRTDIAENFHSFTTTIINAPSRIGSASGWVRVDGKPVMNAITQFAAGPNTLLFNAPSVMENGIDVSQTQSTAVWTGTSQSGTYAGVCGSDVGAAWGATSGNAYFGTAIDTNALVVSTDTDSCLYNFHLYCLGIDRTAIAQ